MNLKWKLARSLFGWKLMYCKVMNDDGRVDTTTEIYAISGPGSDQVGVYSAAYFDFKQTLRVWEGLVEEEIKVKAEDGKVAYIESGRDCDCVEYDGRVHIVDATLQAYQELDERIGEWADGPYHLDLCRVSETQSVRYESHDLAMEAYEDGHPHYIVSRFP